MFAALIQPRRVLLIDATTCAAAGALMTFAAGPLAAMTALPHGLILAAGLALWPVAAFMAWAASRPESWSWTLPLVIAGNLAWIAASVWVLLGFAPSAFGIAFVVAQAFAVAVLTELEMIAAWRARA